MRIKLQSFWPAIIALVVATVLFCLPGKDFPEEDWFALIALDKWIHVGLFCVLVILWSLPFIQQAKDNSAIRQTFIRITLAFVAYGIAIEFIQGQFIPNRTFGVDDMIADAIGCGVGLMLANWQLKIQRR
jgi:VanZ family protein